jgi:hypothetical protein
LSPLTEIPESAAPVALYARVVEIGGVPIALRTSSRRFARMVEERYAGFVTRNEIGSGTIQFDIELLPGAGAANRNDEEQADALKADRLHEVDLHEDDLQEDDLEVTFESGLWRMCRGDFSAEWDPVSGEGRIRQAMNPYSLDSVLRIVHSLVLARRGEFLVHAASAILSRRALLFAGVSGAGKTTISRLAPAHATLLTDEISYVRRGAKGYDAHGTPFAGELARLGTHCSAPLSAVYLLRQGRENRIEEIDPALATQALLRNILFFARDAELVQSIFEGACEFVERVPVRQLTFRKDASVWELLA